MDVTLIAALSRSAKALPFVQYVEHKLSQGVPGNEEVEDKGDTPEGKVEKAPVLNESTVLEILKNTDNPEIKNNLPRSEQELSNLARTVFYLIKAKKLARLGTYGDIPEAGELEANTRATTKSAMQAQFEAYQESFLKAFPKMVLSQQARIKEFKEKYNILYQDLFSGDYGAFRNQIAPLFGGVIPHESLVKYIYDAINKPENSELKAKIDSRLNDLINRSVPEDDEEAVERWATDFAELVEWVIGKVEFIPSPDDTVQDQTQEPHIFEPAGEFIETTPGLITQEERAEIVRRFKEIPGREIAEIANAISNKFQGSGPIVEVLTGALSQINFESPKSTFSSYLSSCGESARQRINNSAPGSLPALLFLIAGVKPEDSEQITGGPPKATITSDEVTAFLEANHVDPATVNIGEVAYQLLSAKQKDLERIWVTQNLQSILNSASELAGENIKKLSPEQVCFTLDLLAHIDPALTQELLENQNFLALLDRAADVATTNPQSADKLRKAILILKNNSRASEYLKRLGFVIEAADKSAREDTAITPTTAEKIGIPKKLAEQLLPLLDKPMVATALGGMGIDVTELKKLLSPTEQSGLQHPTSGISQSQTNKAIPWIIGLVGAVFGLGGYIATEQKGRGILAGLGALGLVGSIIAAVKRNSVDLTKRTQGWLEGRGAWIMALGSALVGGASYYFSGDKVKGALLPVGLGTIGGVLAWYFEPVRTALGLPASEKGPAPAKPQPAESGSKQHMH